VAFCDGLVEGFPQTPTKFIACGASHSILVTGKCPKIYWSICVLELSFLWQNMNASNFGVGLLYLCKSRDFHSCVALKASLVLSWWVYHPSIQLLWGCTYIPIYPSCLVFIYY
jgi:hypothetical protein